MCSTPTGFDLSKCRIVGGGVLFTGRCQFLHTVYYRQCFNTLVQGCVQLSA